MTKEEHKAFSEAYNDVPSQDNEGYTPDRGSFKCGFIAGLEYQKTIKESPTISSAAYSKMVQAMATFIQSRKLDENGLHFVKEATLGFNLACDFLAHELRTLDTETVRELSTLVHKDKV